jgi:large subunit ribosomal protein L9
MKVILLQHVKKVGKKHDVVDVSDGYAQNALFPKKLAVPATPKQLAKIKDMQSQEEASVSREVAMVTSVLTALDGKEIVTKQSMNDKGGLYQALDANKVSEILAAEQGASLDAAHIQLNEPIKVAGKHKIQLKAYDTQATVTLDIQA